MVLKPCFSLRMHDHFPHDLTKAIDAMSDAEKRELIAELSRSLNGECKPVARGDDMPSEQKQAVLDLLSEVDSLPDTAEPADGLVGARDHDQIL